MSKFYYYSMLHRPFSIGCQPSKGLVTAYSANSEVDPNYFDILVYDRKLTAQEIDEYELEEIK